MKMRLWLMLLAVFFLLPVDIVSAVADKEGHLTAEQLKLGELAPTDTREFVENVYGLPEQKLRGGMIYIYGKTFRIKFFRKDVDSSLWDVQVIADNGLGTADGVKVGMDAKSIEQIYGQPDDVKQGTKGTIYKYCGTGKEFRKSLSFYVRDGIIRSISLHWAD